MRDVFVINGLPFITYTQMFSVKYRECTTTTFFAHRNLQDQLAIIQFSFSTLKVSTTDLYTNEYTMFGMVRVG